MHRKHASIVPKARLSGTAEHDPVSLKKWNLPIVEYSEVREHSHARVPSVRDMLEAAVEGGSYVLWIHSLRSKLRYCNVV